MIALAALALAACQREDSKVAEPAPAPPPAAPAPAPPEFAGAIDGRGTEPFFWLLKIRPEKLTLTRPAHMDLMLANVGPKVVGDAAVWETEADSPLSVTLRNVPCTDGMSDKTYPLTASIRAGTDTLKGCASKVDAPLPEPGA
jgi:uncharacterized membrane protein